MVILTFSRTSRHWSPSAKGVSTRSLSSSKGMRLQTVRVAQRHSYMLDNTGLQRVLVNVAQECNKIGDIIDRLTLEAVLEEMARARVFAVEVERIADSKGLDGITDFFFVNLQENMYVIGHETVGIDGTEGRKAIAKLIVLFYELLHVHKHAGMVFEVFEDVLAVYTA